MDTPLPPNFLQTSLQGSKKKIGQAPGGILLYTNNIWPPHAWEKAHWRGTHELDLFIPRCLSFQVRKRGKERARSRSRRQFHALWISQKGVHISLSLSFWARKLTLLWNSAKFVACRGTASGDIPAPGRVMRQRLREPNNSVCLFIFLNLVKLLHTFLFSSNFVSYKGLFQ